MKPINLKDWEVRAILAGRLTQLRRVVKPQPVGDNGTGRWTLTVSSTERKRKGDWNFQIVDAAGSIYTGRGNERSLFSAKCPYGTVGDWLWVRECWQETCDEYGTPVLAYRAGGHCVIGAVGDRREGTWRQFAIKCESGGTPVLESWRPSTQMPKWASRLTLAITSVRVQRVQDATEADALAEGVEEEVVVPGIVRGPYGDPIEPRNNCVSNRDRLAYQWNIDNRNSWEANPWTWVLGVEVKK